VAKDDSILLAANIPEFKNQGVLWFQENETKIKNLSQKNAWWRNHVRILETGLKINPLALMRELADLGYQKTARALKPGEFSFMGSVLQLCPINLDNLISADFNGNLIESIQTLPQPKIKIVPDDLENIAEAYMRFKKGDFVVHLDHGIGRLRGMTPDLENYPRTRGPQTMSNKNEPARRPSVRGSAGLHFEIEYAKGDKLFLPFNQLKKISLYVGFTRPKIYGLGGGLWHKVKTKAKADIIKLAQDLLRLYAHRETASGFSFIKDSSELADLMADFEYPETPDQIKSWQEIAADMENAKPMDRVLVGDVGFGKTELALRAAFKAALSGKQVALIAPTTILAQQHFEVFKNRLDKYAVGVGLLNRLQSKEENKKTVAGLKTGRIDVVIGTHRLLSKDVQFKDLGLLIIDEEQRFGVLQKEKIKKLKANIDVLMLSATPIPRTLYLAMSNLKPISKIQTPPLGRLAVATIVKEFSWQLVKEALEKELARGGQIFFLENRIHKIRNVIENIKKIVPTAKITALHGRLSEKEILSAITAFKSGQSDILVSTTIIENGLDLPNANTLIVSNSTLLGLSQAHQLRGRVGRRDIKAFVYFLYPKKSLTEIVQSRLAALREFSELGAGFKIALRDLELRGAGNILGRNQSGHINQIGLNLYCEMLSQAVEKLKS